MNNQDTRIGFVGGGNMSHAIIRGLLDAGHDPDCLYVSDPAKSQRERIQRLHGDLRVSDDNVATLEASTVLVLADEPQ